MDLGDPYRAAELHGAAQATVDRIGEPWQDPEASYRRESLEALRTRIGAERLERAYADGMALGADGALDLALGRQR